MARNAAGLRRRSPGAASSRVEKLRGGSKAIVDYLADDALRSVVEVTSGAGEATTAYLGERVNRTGFCGGSVYWFPTSAWSACRAA